MEKKIVNVDWMAGRRGGKNRMDVNWASGGKGGTNVDEEWRERCRKCM